MKRNCVAEQKEYCKRVVVTGMGIISSIGNDLVEFKKSLKSGHCGIDFIEFLPSSSFPVKIGAQIKGFSFLSTIDKYLQYSEVRVDKAKKIARRYSYPIQASAISAIEAWIMARLDKLEFPRERIGVVIAGSNITLKLKYDMDQKFVESPEYVLPSYALNFMDTDLVGILSEIFEIQGEGFSVGGASASGNVGIIKASQLIRHGIVDACLVVGALADLSPTELQGFHNLGALGGKTFSCSPQKACRPFDSLHEGFIYGQASGSLVLESLEFAEKHGGKILAEILGESLILDGNRLSNPNENGEAKAMESALRCAGIQFCEVDYINAHGTSTPLGDITEINAISRVFKKHFTDIWINSTKGLTGHCLYSAGIVEAIATIIQMNEGFLHPNLNLIDPINKEGRFVGQTAQNDNINVAMSNSFGFGGINTSIVLGKGIGNSIVKDHR